MSWKKIFDQTGFFVLNCKGLTKIEKINKLLQNNKKIIFVEIIAKPPSLL